MGNDGEVSIKIGLDTKSFDNEIQMVERQLNDLASEYERYSKMEGFDKDKNEMVRIRAEMEKLQNKLVDLNKQKEKWNEQDLKQPQLDLSNISNQTENIIRKIVKWGLALFSIRSAYSFIRGAISELSQSNGQIGADIEYIRWALATALQPIIETIINLAYKLLQYINYIANAWFGVNLFAKATAENFKKAKDGVKGVNKEAKKLQKTLAGFDEMNILQKDGSTSSGGGGGGISLPSTDLSTMLEDVEIPEWVEWIATHGNEIRDTIIGIVEAIALFKFAQLASSLFSVAEGFKFFENGMLTLKGAVVTSGIIILIIGIVNAIQDFEAFLKEPSWENFVKLIDDISTAFIGLGLILVGFNTTNPFGWILIAIGTIEKLLQWMGLWSDSTEEEKSDVEKLKDTYDELNEAKKKVTETVGGYTRAVQQEEEANKKLDEIQKKTGISGKELFDQVKYGVLQYKDLSPEQREVFDAYIKEQEALENLQEKTNKFVQAKSDERYAIIKNTQELSNQGKKYDESFQALIQGVRDGNVSMRDFSKDVKLILGGLSEEGAKTFVKNLPDDIKTSLLNVKNFADVTIQLLDKDIPLSYRDLVNKTNQTFKSDIPNAVDNSIKSANNLEKAFSNVNNLMKRLTGRTINFKVTTSSSGAEFYAKGGIVTKLATGAVVNQPNRGVPVNSAIAGEAGREGILPLTDSQAMEMLGQSIGRYININATIPVYMGNRQIAREIQKIQNEDDFAYNR